MKDSNEKVVVDTFKVEKEIWEEMLGKKDKEILELKKVKDTN